MFQALDLVQFSPHNEPVMEHYFLPFPSEKIIVQLLLLLFSHSVMSDFLQPHGLQHPASLSFTISWSLLKLISIKSVMLSTNSFFIIAFSCLQSFPASGSFPISWFFISGGQSIWVSASASVLPMNMQGWFPLGWADWISLQSKELSRVLSNTTVQKR